VKLLKYPALQQVDAKRQKQVKYIITTLILTLMLPSIYFAYKLIDEKKYNQKIEVFIEKEFINKGYTILYKKIRFNSNPKKIELAFLTKKFSDQEIKSLKHTLNNYKIYNTELNIKQDTTDIKKYILNEINS
ncbi:membrane protein, partial [Flavobacterium sp. ABG]